MAKTKTSKSHKSRKTTPASGSAGRPSSTALAITTPPVPPTIPIVVETKGKEGPALDTGLIQEDPKKQWWYRPPDSKARKLVEKIVVQRAAGHDDKAIAKRLKTTEGSVRQYMYVGRKNGWLDAEDDVVDLEEEMAMSIDRKVVRNINASLDGQMTNWQTHEMTVAAAKGRGHFKTHEVSKNEGSYGLPVVAIQVIMPPVGAGDQRGEIAEDQMGGTPMYLDAEVLNVDPRQALQAGDSSTGPEAAVGVEP